MSLRGRLVLIVLTVAAVGVLVLDVVSYVALRTYLLDRVDEQASSAAQAGPGLVAAPDGDRGSRTPYGPLVGEGTEPPGPGPGEGPPPDGPAPDQLPAGTVVELRDEDGNVIDSRNLSFGDEEEAPELGADVPDPVAGEVVLESVSADDGDYRAAVARVGDGGQSVVIAIPLNDVESTLGRLLAILAIVSAAILAVAAALAWWAVRLGLRPLRQIEATALEIAAGDMSKRVEVTNGNTEVGHLGSAFNEMVERIGAALAARERSEERLRRFLADASHELRTPLASIRGYSELFRIGGTRDPDDLELALRRIESEAERMGLLVDDLLALARSDEERAIVRQRVRFGELVSEIVDDARVRAPDRVIGLTVTDADQPIDADPEQLRRAISNLVANALTHTPQGTPVDVSMAGSSADVTVRVRDHGPGLEPGAEDKVFERFWRSGSDEARSRRSGAGLGLAIVAAVAAAHGGTASAHNAQGGGAEFRLDLPRVAPPDPG